MHVTNPQSNRSFVGIINIINAGNTTHNQIDNFLEIIKKSMQVTKLTIKSIFCCNYQNQT